MNRGAFLQAVTVAPLVAATNDPVTADSTARPAGSAIPDMVETRLGTLRFTDGFPDAKSVDPLYDNLDYPRAVLADNRPENVFVNVSCKDFSTIAPADYEFWNYLNTVVQSEPGEWLNPVRLGFFAAIGFETGKPFAPDGMPHNWLQTVPGKGWNMLFQLYGPLQPWSDGSWRPGKIERME
jgi:hypothetical protein